MSQTKPDPLEELKFTAPEPPRAKVVARIKERCTRDLKPEHPLALKKRVLLSALLALFGLCAIVVLRLGHLSSLGGLFEDALYGTLGWVSVVLGVLVVGLARPPGRRVARPIRVVLAMAVPIVFLVYLALLASSILPLGQAVRHASMVSCGLHTLVSSAAVALCMMLPWRRTDPFSPGLTGALFGLGGGLAAAIAMGTVCPSREAWHLWLAHGLTLAGAVVIGALVGRRWLAP